MGFLKKLFKRKEQNIGYRSLLSKALFHLEICNFLFIDPIILWFILDGHGDGGYPVCAGAYVQ